MIRPLQEGKVDRGCAGRSGEGKGREALLSKRACRLCGIRIKVGLEFVDDPFSVRW